MTLTLQKVSQISHISLRLMSPNETDMIFHDLKSLISIDLPMPGIAGCILSSFMDKSNVLSPTIYYFRETLYWCSIDLTKYYPSIKMDVLEEQIIKHCSITKDSSAARLISTLVFFGSENISCFCDNNPPPVCAASLHT